MRKPKHRRLRLLVFSMVCLAGAAGLLSVAFREYLVYYRTPSELAADSGFSRRTLRVGGLVEAGSIVREGLETRFRLTDGEAALSVRHQGLLPPLFREGQGVVAEGVRQEDGTFAAKTLLTKHDERYMPPEVAEALKRSGQWKGGAP